MAIGKPIHSLDDVYDLLNASRFREAGELLQMLLDENPNDADAHRTYAMLLQRDARPVEAAQAMRCAVEVEPKNVMLQLELSQILVAMGSVDEAIHVLNIVTSSNPEMVEAWHLLGMTLYKLRRDKEAQQALRRAHVLKPDDRHIARGLAEAEYAAEHYFEAIDLYESLAATQKQDDVSLYLRLSQCNRRSGNLDLALTHVQKGIEYFPDNAALWLELGWVHEGQGAATNAFAAHRHAHQLRPDWADPLASAILLDDASDLIKKAETLLTLNQIPNGELAYLHHALGKRADLEGSYTQAAEHWQVANRLRREADGCFERDKFSSQVNAAIASFNAEQLAASNRNAWRDERPIFVVGMPRSGTTLVEQILATHPLVHGCGELIGIVSIADEISAEAGLRWPQDAASVDVAWLHNRAKHYLHDAQRNAGGESRRLVDKQPYNFLHLALISMLFSGARVVWCRRNPRDVAVSIFSENFSSSATYATDLDDIAFVIDQQDRLMLHWQQILPLPLLELHYEDLVDKPETQMRRLIEFAGLPWSVDCLNFHQSQRSVQTPSRWQVRRPLHQRSVGRWQSYSQWFDNTHTAF
jgi:tetratricopeptide (TPR) repeat protein